MKIAKIFATGISGDIRSEFTVYNVKDIKTIKLTDQCKCYQFLGCENNTGKRRMRSVWNMATTASGGVTHYAKFPNELAERCILCGTAEGDVVLDPFVGSGTSCRVANRYGRQYIGD